MDTDELTRERWQRPAPPPSLGLCVCGEFEAMWYRTDQTDDNYCDACFELAVPQAQRHLWRELSGPTPADLGPPNPWA